MPAEGNEELFAAFVAEANESLADMETDFLAIEEAGEDIDTDLVNKVFRGIHSMKGTAGYLGLKSIGELAHEMENILNLVRNQELVPTSQIMEVLLHGADALVVMVGDIHASNEYDVSEHTQALTAIIASDTSAETKESIEGHMDIELPTGELVFMMVPRIDVVSRQRQGQHIYIVQVDFIEDVQGKDRTPVDFLKAVDKIGELIDTYLSTAGVGDLADPLPDELTFLVLMGSKSDQAQLADALQIPAARIHHIFEPDAQGTKEPQAAATSEESTQVGASSESETAAKPRKRPVGKPGGSASPADASLRVNVAVLDSLMNLAGELVLSRNQLLQSIQTTDPRGLETVAARIDQVTSELQDAIMQTRMQTIGNVFSKFQRVVRDLSKTLGKQMDLVIEGKEVELDKKIIESIGDPLTHLVRNSVDHGIEMPSVRSSKGKSPTGRICLRAFHQGGKVNIEISDDGAGINAEKLKAKAVEKGVITAEQARDMKDREALRLILHPGFSMAEQLTDVSGRGVGMDVVRTNIENLGGTIDIDTQIGVGTTMRIKLPLTLAIIPSLVVRCGEERFAIPQVNIRELVRIKASDVREKIEKVKNAEVLRLRGSLLPLVRLSDALGNQSTFLSPETQELEAERRTNISDRRAEADCSESSERRSDSDRRADTLAGALNIIVVESGHLRYGLIVDALNDSQEIVVKPLGRHMKESPCLAGATIMGDGYVALILDVSGVASHLHLRMPDSDADQGAENEQAGRADETQSFLLFNNAPHEFFGIPMGVISRIERIRTAQIDIVSGQEVLQYRGTSLPLLSLEKHIKADPKPEANNTYVVVFTINNHEVGLIAPQLEDIRELSTEIDTMSFREDGVLGSTIVGENITRLIDLFELTETAHPEWFTKRETVERSCGSVSRILFAEDSEFFRKQVTKFLESGGYEVVACEDGQVAWDTLQDPEQKFDLVVTDIEMPNMDGLELTRLIKGDPCFAHLPVIAVTSLAGEDDLARGADAGVDDYQIKMDREKLMAAVTKHLKQAKTAAGLGETPTLVTQRS